MVKYSGEAPVRRCSGLAIGAELNLNMDDTSTVVPEWKTGLPRVNGFDLDDLDSMTHSEWENAWP
jgi:hypothetical protein